MIISGGITAVGSYVCGGLPAVGMAFPLTLQKCCENLCFLEKKQKIRKKNLEKTGFDKK